MQAILLFVESGAGMYIDGDEEEESEGEMLRSELETSMGTTLGQT